MNSQDFTEFSLLKVQLDLQRGKKKKKKKNEDNTWKKYIAPKGQLNSLRGEKPSEI